MAKTPRTWTGARSPSGLKRVRNSQRRRDVLQPRRSAAKTYVAKAVSAAAHPSDGIDPQEALAEALSALDRAAKAGAIHPNAAARRKSRLTLKVNAAVGGAAGMSAGSPADRGIDLEGEPRLAARGCVRVDRTGLRRAIEGAERLDERFLRIDAVCEGMGGRSQGLGDVGLCGTPARLQDVASPL